MILVIDSVFLEKLLKHIIMYICLSLLPPNQNRWLRLCGWRRLCASSTTDGQVNAHMLHGKQRGAGELMALNVFGDSTRSWQPCTSFLGSPSPPELEELPVIDLDLFAATQGLPSKVDWRSTNVVTYVKK